MNKEDKNDDEDKIKEDKNDKEGDKEEPEDNWDKKQVKLMADMTLLNGCTVIIGCIIGGGPPPRWKRFCCILCRGSWGS